MKVDIEKLTVTLEKLTCALEKTSESVTCTNLTLKFKSVEELAKRATGTSAVVWLQASVRGQFKGLKKTTDYVGFKTKWQSLSDTTIEVPAVGERLPGEKKPSAKEQILSMREMFPGITSDEMVELALAWGSEDEPKLRAAMAKKYPKNAEPKKS